MDGVRQKKGLEADADLKVWTKKQIELEEEEARSRIETARDERLLGNDSMMDILAEQVKLMDIWIDDMEIGVRMMKEKAFVADKDEEMEDLDRMCLLLRVEEMEQDDGHFAWGEEYLAHMEIDEILMEKHGELYTEKRAGTDKDANVIGYEFGSSNGLCIGNNLAYESAYNYGGT